MPTVDRAGRTIHFTRDGSGPAVVLVPGLGSGARLFGTLPRRFARAGFTCVAVDPVGLPPSSPLPAGAFDFGAAAADVRAVAATLPRPVTLVGTSLGGKVALTAAGLPELANSGVAALCLVCSSAMPTARSLRVYRWFELLAGAVAGELLGELTAPFLFGATFLRERAALVDDILRAMRPTAESSAFMLAQARALQTFDGTATARHCPLPTLCLGGAEDTLTLPEEVAATAAIMPTGRLLTIPAAGHSLLLESAAAFDAIATWARDPGGLSAAR